MYSVILLPSRKTRLVMSDEPDWIQRALAQEERFWAEQYPDFSRKEKIRLWTADLSRDMRAQEEANANQYALSLIHI